MTATEGLAFGGLILSLFLGYLGYRTGKEARDDARALAREGREHARDEARASRLFDVRRSVYVDALDYAYRIETSVDRTEPAFTWEGMPGPPVFPPEDEQIHQSAQMAAFGSRAVQDKLMDLKRATQEFQGAVWLFQGERGRELHGDKQIEARLEVNAKRDAVKAVVREVIESVNAELAG